MYTLFHVLIQKYNPQHIQTLFFLFLQSNYKLLLQQQKKKMQKKGFDLQKKKNAKVIILASTR